MLSMYNVMINCLQINFSVTHASAINSLSAYICKFGCENILGNTLGMQEVTKYIVYQLSVGGCQVLSQ